MKKKISSLLFGLVVIGLPLLSNLATSQGQAYGIASIWTESKVLATGAVMFEAAAGVGLAVGAICPPQAVALILAGA